MFRNISKSFFPAAPPENHCQKFTLGHWPWPRGHRKTSFRNVTEHLKYECKNNTAHKLNTHVNCYGISISFQIGSLENYYLFEHHAVSKRSTEPSSHHVNLHVEPQVSSSLISQLISFILLTLTDWRFLSFQCRRWILGFCLYAQWIYCQPLACFSWLCPKVFFTLILKWNLIW